MTPDPIVGATVKLRARFFALDGAPLVPTDVALEIELPDDTLVHVDFADLELEGDFFVYRLQTSVAGTHRERWEAVEGDDTVVAQGKFYVHPRNVPLEVIP